MSHINRGRPEARYMNKSSVSETSRQTNREHAGFRKRKGRREGKINESPDRIVHRIVTLSPIFSPSPPPSSSSSSSSSSSFSSSSLLGFSWAYFWTEFPGEPATERIDRSLPLDVGEFPRAPSRIFVLAILPECRAHGESGRKRSETHADDCFGVGVACRAWRRDASRKRNRERESGLYTRARAVCSKTLACKRSRDRSIRFFPWKKTHPVPETRRASGTCIGEHVRGGGSGKSGRKNRLVTLGIFSVE